MFKVGKFLILALVVLLIPPLDAYGQEDIVGRVGIGFSGTLNFPIGGLEKKEIRGIAAKACLPVAEKPDSQDICFISDSYADFIRESAPESIRPGKIVDSSGKVLGDHEGIAFFTIGQSLSVCLTKP